MFLLFSFDLLLNTLRKYIIINTPRTLLYPFWVFGGALEVGFFPFLSGVWICR
jgi:hypothetical protein